MSGFRLPNLVGDKWGTRQEGGNNPSVTTTEPSPCAAHLEQSRSSPYTQDRGSGRQGGQGTGCPSEHGGEGEGKGIFIYFGCFKKSTTAALGTCLERGHCHISSVDVPLVTEPFLAAAATYLSASPFCNKINVKICAART